ncbi:hypothetical protein L4C36_03835 [Photobacterium japonica]|uniref:DUF6701 domain-containing protein n=1 Tax=Photobacterium japonica TaxID=2910235 RepID=UPI003D0B7A12
MTLSNETFIRGAITSCQLQMTEESQVIGDSVCFAPKEYFIEVTPEKDESLTCDRQKVTVRVLDKNGQVATDYTGQINLSTSLTNANKAEWFTAENDGQSLGDAKDRREITPIHGQKTLWLNSNYIGNITVTATLSTDDKKTDIGTFLFVPYGFEIAEGEIPLVAGKPQDVEIRALTCATPSSPSDNDENVAKGYEGRRELTLNTLYDAPSSGSKPVELAPQNTDNWQKDKIILSFVSGKAKAKLRYLDAGKVRLAMTDERCTTSDCAVLPASQRMGFRIPENWQGITGSLSIKSRPYTFALCDAPDALSIEQAKGTASNTENAFVAAGERFATRVKPVIWTESDAGKDNIDPNGDATKLVDTRNLCGRKETTNFYHAQAPAATVQLSIPAGNNAKPHSPNVIGARPGVLTSQSLSHQQIVNNPFYASWNEVGSIQLRAGVDGTYLDMKVNVGYRPVGRFYPKFMAVDPNQSGMTYPKGQGFVYMNQPLNGRLKVQALNQQREPTYNYGHFSAGNKIGIQVVAVAQNTPDGTGNRLTERMDFSEWDRVAGNGWQRNWEQEAIIVPTAPLLFTRLNVIQGVAASRFGTTQPDGPYRVSLGIAPQESDNCSQIGCPVLDEPKIKVFNCQVGSVCSDTFPAKSFATFTTRYGRMVMDDTAGRAGTPLAIPLRVEHWNGSAFMAHDEDNVSAFDGQYYCKQILMQSDTSVDSDTLMSGGGVVEKGVAASGQLLAHPHDLPQYREQTRFWQKLVDQTPAREAANDPVILCEPGAVDRNGESQPWLLYNWRQQGDENPSALVTFGTYRGNDRVIYRGEKGMNFRLP